MIIKAYHPNGSPDLRRWTVHCDNRCPVSAPVLRSKDWLIPKQDGMPCYCPACTEYLAMCVISWALTCPACGSPALDYSADYGDSLVICPGDGVTPCSYLAPDGWHCACCGDPLDGST